MGGEEDEDKEGGRESELMALLALVGTGGGAFWGTLFPIALLILLGGEDAFVVVIVVVLFLGVTLAFTSALYMMN